VGSLLGSSEHISSAAPSELPVCDPYRTSTSSLLDCAIVALPEEVLQLNRAPVATTMNGTNGRTTVGKGMFKRGDT